MKFWLWNLKRNWKKKLEVKSWFWELSEILTKKLLFIFLLNYKKKKKRKV